MEAGQPILERWLEAVVRTPGLTAIRDPVEARRALLDDALRGVEVLSRYDGPIVDVGSGGGTPGIPLAVSLPDRVVTLLEAERRKCDFLERWENELANLRVVWGRAEEQPIETFGVAVAKALAHPPTAASGACRSCGKAARSCCGSARRAERERIAAVAEQLGGKLVESPEGFP